MAWQRLGGVVAAAVLVALLVLVARPAAGKKRRTQPTHAHEADQNTPRTQDGGDAEAHAQEGGNAEARAQEGGDAEAHAQEGEDTHEGEETKADTHVGEAQGAEGRAVGQQVEVALRGTDLGVAALAGCDGVTTARLVGVLGSEGAVALSSDQKGRLLGTLANSAAFSANSSLIQAEGGLPMVLHALGDEDQGVQSKALWAVGNLALNPDSHSTLAEAIPQLVATIRAGPEPGRASSDQAMALRALLNLAGSSSTHEAMRREGLLPLLVACLHEEGADRLLALRLVANLSIEEANALPLVQAGLLPHLRGLLSLDDDQWLVRALLVATNLLTHLHGEVGPARLQDAEWLVGRCEQLQASGGDEVREKACALAATLKPYMAKT